MVKFKNWIELELNGYGKDSDIPQYRIIGGEVKALNPYHGWRPIVIDNSELAEIISKKPVDQAVGEIEKSLREYKSDSLNEELRSSGD